MDESAPANWHKPISSEEMINYESARIMMSSTDSILFMCFKSFEISVNQDKNI